MLRTAAVEFRVRRLKFQRDCVEVVVQLKWFWLCVGLLAALFIVPRLLDRFDPVRTHNVPSLAVHNEDARSGMPSPSPQFMFASRAPQPSTATKGENADAAWADMSGLLKPVADLGAAMRDHFAGGGGPPKMPTGLPSEYVRAAPSSYPNESTELKLEDVCGPMLIQEQSLDCERMPSAIGYQCCCRPAKLHHHHHHHGGSSNTKNGGGHRPAPNKAKMLRGKQHWRKLAEADNATAAEHGRMLAAQNPLRLGDDEVICLPSVMIIGAQKSGTTVLLSYLLTHPKFMRPKQKEVMES